MKDTPDSPPPLPPTKLEIAREIFLGLVILVSGHVLALMALVLVMGAVGVIWGGYSALIPLIIAGYGWTFLQLIYVLPLIFLYRRKKRPYVARGILIGAVITALLHGGICYVPLFLMR